MSGKRPATPRRDNSAPASFWKEKEFLKGRLVNAGVIILRTSGCSHFHEGGCSMCGYNLESSSTVSPEDLERQFERAVTQLGEIDLLKVYTSGSFLDEREIARAPARSIMKYCSNHGARLLFESRPEYVTQASMQRVLDVHEDVEVALGLESSNDNVLKYSINKGFSLADYQRAADVVRHQGADVRTYVLLKPPFLSEAEAIADSVETMRTAAKSSEAVSLNPVNVQKRTVVEKLWKAWAYRPPWLWSVLEVLMRTKYISRKVVCDPTGGGRARGAHNCGKCDEIILDSIRSYSLSQDSTKLAKPECECHEAWRTVVDLESFVMGGICDLQRFYRRRA